MARVVALVAAVVVTACGALGCATTPAFSANAVEPATPGGAFELRFELVNRTNDRQTLSIGAESIHIESVTRDGKAVAPEQKDVTPPENPIPQRGETLPIVEPDGVVAFFTRGGLSDLVLTGDVWHRRVFPLEHGHYRVTFSYQYRGTADGKPKLFTGRLVDKVRFDIE
jgi:hypothetical protein